jgi:dihydrofolate reductase
MRRLRYMVAMSLDGYIAGSRGEADWIVMDPDIDFADIMSQFDTLVMGRRTFVSSGASTGSGSSGPGPFAGMRTIVVSHTLNGHKYPGVTIVSSDIKERVAALKAEAGKDIWLFGGGELFRSLLDLNLVDTIEVAVIPILLGQGIPLLPPPAPQASLTLARHVVYPQTGTVALTYDVASART